MAIIPLPGPHTLMVLAMIPLFIWRMISRLKRMIGRQKYSRRHWLTVGLLPFIFILIIVLTGPDAFVLAVMTALATAGVVLAFYGLKLTHFEAHSEEGSFYTPHPAIGIALSALIAMRVIYRLFQLLIDPELLADPATALAHSPVTMGLLALIVGYYVTYSAGVLRWRRTHPKTALRPKVK